MKREAQDSDGTGFNWVVYSENGMAKETVGVRVPVAIAEQVDRHAETHDMTRTEAMVSFVRCGLEYPDAHRESRVYTAQIRESQWDSDMARVGWASEPSLPGVEETVKQQLRVADRIPGDYEENMALTARMPGDVVRGIEQWAESEDLAQSVAAEDLLVRGMKADPLPPGNEDPIPETGGGFDGGVKTIELESEEADLFRRCRLYYRMGPTRCVNQLLGASKSSKSARVGWAKPDESDE